LFFPWTLDIGHVISKVAPKYFFREGFSEKMFQTKVVWVEGEYKRVPDLILGDIVKDQGHIDFLNGSPYFLFQNLIADSKSFLKHYNEISRNIIILSYLLMQRLRV